MTAFKGTQGPWKNLRNRIEGADRQEICEIFACDADDKTTLSPVADANARLIAAAPDLLEALNSLLNYQGNSEEHTRRNLRRAECLARAAIAQAIGE